MIWTIFIIIDCRDLSEKDDECVWISWEQNKTYEQSIRSWEIIIVNFISYRIFCMFSSSCEWEIFKTVINNWFITS